MQGTLSAVTYESFRRAALVRTLPVAFALALVLAGCDDATPKDPDPDTAPKFGGSVDDRTYRELEPIEPLTLPRATGGNGSLRYSLGPELPPGLSFDRGARKLTGTPQRTTDRLPVTYDMTYRVEDSDDNKSPRDTDTLRFSITIRPLTVLEQVASSVAVGEAEGSLRFESLPLHNGGPAILLQGSDTIVAGGAFFLQVAPEPGATVDALLVSVDGERAGFFEIDVQGAAAPYLLVGQVPYELDPTRSEVRICVTAVHALNRVGATECRELAIAEAAAGAVRITLSWDAASAVDLLVLDPRGNAVPREALGGRDDPDSNPSCDTLDRIRNEQVAWSAGSADGGRLRGARTSPGCVRIPSKPTTWSRCGTGRRPAPSPASSSAPERKLRSPRSANRAPSRRRRSGRRSPKRTTPAAATRCSPSTPKGQILDDTRFTLRLGNAEADVYLIATNTGHHPMQPQVVRLDRTESATAAGQAAAAASRRMQHATAGSAPAGRARVTEFNNDSPLPAPRTCNPPQTAQPVTEGKTQFDFLSPDSDGTLLTIPATARKVVADGATTLVVWVANDDWATCTDCVRAEMVDALSARFLQPAESNDIYQLVTAIFGDPWGPHEHPCLIPGDSEGAIHVLLYDIDDDGLPAAGETRERGFFWSKDNYLRDSSDAVTRTSNERLMLYLDAPLLAQSDDANWKITDQGPRQALATLIHELQHMIHFYQKRVLRGVASETWLNEMASEVAEDLLANKLAIDGPRAVKYDSPAAGTPQNSGGRLPLYNLHNDLRVTAWDGTARSSAINYALGAYLARTYGGAALFSDVVQSRLAGVTAVERAVAQAPGTDGSVSFADLLADWAVANLLSDDLQAAHPYRYNPGQWVESETGGVSFVLGSINLYHYRYETPSVTQEGPFLYSLDGFNARIQPPHSNMYADLGRVSGTLRLRVSAESGNRITVVVKD